MSASSAGPKSALAGVQVTLFPSSRASTKSKLAGDQVTPFPCSTSFWCAASSHFSLSAFLRATLAVLVVASSAFWRAMAASTDCALCHRRLAGSEVARGEEQPNIVIA